MPEKRLTKEIAEQFLADDSSVDLRDFKSLPADLTPNFSQGKTR